MQTTSRKPASSRKAQTPAQQLTSAIERAKRDHITVAGSGTFADGSRFWLVASQSVEGMHHVVKQTGKSLECDCIYSQMRGKVCVHRAATFLHLQQLAQAAKKQEASKPQPAPAKPTPTMAQRAAEALPYDSGEGFSIYVDTPRERAARANYQPVAGRAQADQHGNDPNYAPRDYVSHQYR